MFQAQADHAGSLALRCVVSLWFGSFIASFSYAGRHSRLRIAERQIGEAGSRTARARCNADSAFGKQPALLRMLERTTHPALTCQQAQPARRNAELFGSFFGRKVIGCFGWK